MKKLSRAQSAGALSARTLTAAVGGIVPISRLPILNPQPSPWGLVKDNPEPSPWSAKHDPEPSPW